jgi:hypothetical protein
VVTGLRVEARAGLLTQILNHGCGNRGHPRPLAGLWVKPEGGPPPVKPEGTPIATGCTLSPV